MRESRERLTKGNAVVACLPAGGRPFCQLRCPCCCAIAALDDLRQLLAQKTDRLDEVRRARGAIQQDMATASVLLQRQHREEPRTMQFSPTPKPFLAAEMRTATRPTASTPITLSSPRRLIF